MVPSENFSIRIRLSFVSITCLTGQKQLLYEKKQNPSCPVCNETTRRKGVRRGSVRYRCNGTPHHSFAISHRPLPPLLWLEHIDGVSSRKLADELGYSRAKAFRHIENEIAELPSSNVLTKNLCTRFCGILIVDAKYVKVRGYPKKIPFIFCIDYLTHDIVACLLAPSENQIAYERFFGMLRRMQYPMRIVCVDDNGATGPALARVFPRTPLQRCQNHYVENIRQLLRVRTDETHQPFFYELKRLVFDEHENFARLRGVLHHLLTKYALNDSARQQILLDI